MTNMELNALMEKVENVEQLMADLRSAADEETVMEVLKAHNLDITLEDLEAILPGADELSEDDLSNVAGGCKCKAPLKRLINNFLSWVSKRITGKGVTCFDCNDD